MLRFLAMSVITFSTDFGAKDFLFSQIRGIISSSDLSIKIVENTHCIEPFNNLEAAYVVKNTYHYFPKNSIHIISVGVQSYERYLLAYIRGHYFITADNGILSLVFDDEENAVYYSIKNEDLGHTVIFPTRDYFIQVAIEIAKGTSIEYLGEKVFDIKKINNLQPTIKGNLMNGIVTYIDSYGNAVTNIKKEFLLEWLAESKYSIFVRNDIFNKIHSSYSGIVTHIEKDSKFHGKGLVLFNSAGYLEIAVYKSNSNTFGSANTLYNLSYGNSIMIEKENG